MVLSLIFADNIHPSNDFKIQVKKYQMNILQ